VEVGGRTVAPIAVTSMSNEPPLLGTDPMLYPRGSAATLTSEHNMARFKIATVDGYEVMVEHQSETPEVFVAAMNGHKTIEATEIIRGSHGEPEKRGKIVLFTDHIVAIREA